MIMKTEGAKEPDSCRSEKCPHHGHLRTRKKTFVGTVVSSRNKDTATVEWDYYRHVPKYERSERRKTRISCHNPACITAKPGDVVTVAECRPLSKSKRFVIIEKK